MAYPDWRWLLARASLACASLLVACSGSQGETEAAASGGVSRSAIPDPGLEPTEGEVATVVEWDGAVAADPDFRPMPDGSVPETTEDDPDDDPDEDPGGQGPDSPGRDGGADEPPGKTDNTPEGSADAGKTTQDAGTGNPPGDDEDDAGTDTCEPVTLARGGTSGHGGTLLLLQDRSGSMSENWNGTAYWDGVGTAVQQALATVPADLEVGALFFPGIDPDAASAVCTDPTGITCIFLPGLTVGGATCAINPIDADDQLTIRPVAGFLTAYTAPNPYEPSLPLYGPVAGAQTPLLEVLQEGDTVLQATPGAMTVVLITDGKPNCAWDETMALSLVSQWQSLGIPTHVLAVSMIDATGQAVADALAGAGGTGQAQFLADPAALELSFGAIARSLGQPGADPCNLPIRPAVANPAAARLVVSEGGQAFQVAPGQGLDTRWRLNVDGSQAALTGELCAAVVSGRLDALSLEYGCEPLPAWVP